MQATCDRACVDIACPIVFEGQDRNPNRSTGWLGIRVHGLQLGGTDLTSAAAKMTMNVLVAVAQFERDLLIERTQAGLRRALGLRARIERQR
jgi:hypothetical protein